MRRLGVLTAAWLALAGVLVAYAASREAVVARGAGSVSVATVLFGPALPTPSASPGGVVARRQAARARAGLALATLVFVLGAVLVVGRGWWRAAAVGLLSLAAGLCLLEVATRVLGLHFPALPRVTEDSSWISVYDRTKGWFHRPGAHGAMPIVGGGPARVRINALGLRGPEVSPRKPPGVFRILVLGDSFAFGMGVDEELLFTTLLEGLLERVSGGRDFEVVNLGVLGYATDQELILFQEVGARLAPDLVVLLMCDNDFEGNVLDFVYRRYYKPYFELTADGSLRARSNPVPLLDRWQRTKLFLGQEVNLWNAVRSRHGAPDFVHVAVPRRSGSDPILVTAALVEKLDAVVSAAGARLLVTNTGHRGEETPLFHALRRQLPDLAHLGLEGALGRARQSSPDRLWDFPENTHWNRDAHQLVAQVLAGHVIRHGMVPRPAAPAAGGS